MKTKAIIPKKETVKMNFILTNEGVYSVPDCNDRIATFTMNGEKFCSIYVFESGEIEALDVSFFEKSDKFEKLDESVSVSFDKF